ncbi:pyridoxal phosphate-dependent transferase [Fimicolochytrium jonesii]|uniref:pyridoxal phosphate-dependent transferase n=1 Tax=Fimicolochytrium jonesii TaxID=1396493 RepID=UPI0022FEE4A0|nr:pyridoxal phosphate-dependent transferase [Fimicolochytrium jonesii]KAI8823698.1 pyridoxal phosphate-dependent transferase [Fimicolochytrium jonesii]
MAAPMRSAVTKVGAEMAAFGKQHLGRGIARATELVWDNGKGSWLYTVEGQKYLDFTCGIGVTNLGHCHPKVVKAAQRQCDRIIHAQINAGYQKPQLELVQKLLPVMPHESLDTFLWFNSGSEASENAVKLARHATKKQNVIVMQGAFHGRTFGAMSMTRSKTIYSAGFGPLMSGVYVTPFPYTYHYLRETGGDKATAEDRCADHAIRELKLLLKQQTPASDTAAIIIEPVLGEGGYVPAPQRYMEQLRKLCDENNILLIIDEVQSGFGRTGTYFAIEQYGVRPDILVMAKGIANGFPLSGLASRKELMDKQAPGSMGGTYSGNAVACAAGVACADVMHEEKILENVAARGAQLRAGLESLRTSPTLAPLIGDIRGRGLMVGLEFSPEAPAGISARVQKACLDRGLLVLTTSVFETLRFIPPLTVSKEEMEKGLEIFGEAVREAVEA